MLTEEQKEAVRYGDGPLRIIAGAGTGKTFTIVERIKSLVKEKGISGGRVLVLTFTNKAAHELHERLVEKECVGVNAMTFHSLAAKLLRKFWKGDFEILEALVCRDFIKEILNEEERKELKNIMQDLDKLRQIRVLEEERLSKFDRFSKVSIERLEEILDEYENILAEKNAFDFSGLLIGLYKFWLADEEIFKKCQELFDYVLVDEYQDVNDLQVRILEKLVARHGNICVVGDNDQTIYSWRGANERTLQEFEEIFFGTETVILTRNFRNPSAVLKGAQSLISYNKNRIDKELKSELEEKGLIGLWESKNDYQQNEVFFYLLEKYLGATSEMHLADQLESGEDREFCGLSDIAILYRTQAEGKYLAELLSKKGYSFQISSGDYFWERKEIKDFVESLKSLDESKIVEIERVNGKFSEWMSRLIDQYIEENKFNKMQGNRMKSLIIYCVQFDGIDVSGALSAFLDEVVLEQEADNLLYADRINLLTLHATKGLEFPVVLIFGLEEGKIPLAKLSDDEYWLGEERRLLYVGMTRARGDLHLFCKGEKSRFLTEIGMENMVLEKLPPIRAEKLKKKEMKRAQMSLF